MRSITIVRNGSRDGRKYKDQDQEAGVLRNFTQPSLKKEHYQLIVSLLILSILGRIIRLCR